MKNNLDFLRYLEFAFSDISIPVGRVQYLNMHPMTFYEYLIAVGKKPMTAFIHKSPSEVDPKIQKKILSEKIQSRHAGYRVVTAHLSGSRGIGIKTDLAVI